MKLNGIFKDGMVFQSDKEIRVFGTVETAGEDCLIQARLKSGNKVRRMGETYEIYDDGFFLIIMPPLHAGGPYTLEVTSSAEGPGADVIINDVYVGEVWLAGGQSNMEYPLGRSRNASKVVPECPDTNIHFYKVPVADKYDDALAKTEEETGWIRINKDTCFDMSGVAFFFARKVEDYLKQHSEDAADLHFGIIGCYLGGSSVSAWQSIESLEKTEEGRRYLDDYQDECNKWASEEEYLDAEKEFSEAVQEYEGKISEAMKDHPYLTYAEADKLVGGGPWPPPMGPIAVRRPGALFDGMITRLIPFAIRGVIFYQGEEDTGKYADDYAVVFKTMIEEWREVFWDEELPFIFCQLPMFNTRDMLKNDDYKWPLLRTQQQVVNDIVNNTSMAVLIDCGELDNVHPSDKKTPGERLAVLALRFVYGFDELPAIYPYCAEVNKGYGLELLFLGDFERLHLITRNSSTGTGFEVAGEDGEFVPATALIDVDGRTVHVSARKVPDPKYVRYAFSSYGPATLMSDTGLPAAPFESGVD